MHVSDPLLLLSFYLLFYPAASQQEPPPYQPSPVQGFFLLVEYFSCFSFFLVLGDQALGFCKPPGVLHYHRSHLNGVDVAFGGTLPPRCSLLNRALLSLPHWQENVSYNYKYFIRRFTPSQIRPVCLLYLLCSIVFCQLVVLPERWQRLVWGWEKGCVAVVVSYQTARISLSPLETSAHSFLYQDALIYRLRIQPFISLYPTLTCSPLSLFNFPFKKQILH